MNFLILLLFESTFATLPGRNVLHGDQVISNFSKTKTRHLPEDQVISKLPDAKLKKALHQLGIKDKDLLENIKKSHQVFKEMNKGDLQPPVIEDKVKFKMGAISKPITKRRKVKIAKARVKRAKKQSSIRVYINEGEAVFSIPETVTLPSGSLTPAILMAGVEVSTEKKLVDVKIDYAFIGPNHAVVEMTDCHIWLEVWGNYNTERIYGRTLSLTCRSYNGQTFEIPLEGQLRDSKDEYIGIKAKLVTRGKIAAAALKFLQEGTAQFGKAIAAAQVTTEVVSGGADSGAQKGQNISGDQSRYIMGQSIAGATGGFLEWWINYYKGLSPTLAIAPGSKIFLAIKGEVQIPKSFFKDAKNDYGRVNTNDTLTILKEEQ